MKLFHRKKEEYLSKSSFDDATLSSTFKQFWEPLMSEFQRDLSNLSKGFQLPLKKVEFFFSEISNKKTLKEELDKWCDVVGEDDKCWIGDAAQKILDYQEICRYSYSAQTLMQLKRTLKLTGDFSAVEALVLKEVEILTCKKCYYNSYSRNWSRTLRLLLQVLKAFLQKQLVF